MIHHWPWMFSLEVPKASSDIAISSQLNHLGISGKGQRRARLTVRAIVFLLSALCWQHSKHLRGAHQQMPAPEGISWTDTERCLQPLLKLDTSHQAVFSTCQTQDFTHSSTVVSGTHSSRLTRIFGESITVYDK